MSDESAARFRDRDRDLPRAEESIRRLEGVESCGIVATPLGEIHEIHVVSSGRHPKQIIRDIESTLFADFGIRIDHRKVSVAVREKKAPAPPPEPDPESADAASTNGRLEFFGLRMGVTKDGGEVEVVLRRGAFRGFGKATFDADAEPIFAVAEATLAAVGKFVREGRFKAGAVRRERIGDFEAILVQVTHTSSGRSTPLVGSSLVDRDPNRAALSAALDAVNRFVGRLDSAEGLEVVVGPGPALV